MLTLSSYSNKHLLVQTKEDVFPSYLVYSICFFLLFLHHSLFSSFPFLMHSLSFLTPLIIYTLSLSLSLLFSYHFSLPHSLTPSRSPTHSPLLTLTPSTLTPSPLTPLCPLLSVQGLNGWYELTNEPKGDVPSHYLDSPTFTSYSSHPGSVTSAVSAPNTRYATVEVPTIRTNSI